MTYFKLLVRTVSTTVRMVDFVSHIPTLCPLNKAYLMLPKRNALFSAHNSMPEIRA